jgi:hypothetical protein
MKNRPAQPIFTKPAPGPTSHGWHQVSSFFTCPKEFQFRQVRKLRSPKVQTPDYLAIGLLFHAGRARWFAKNFDTSKKTWDSINAALAAEVEEQKLPVALNAEQKARELLTQYIEHYSKLPKPRVVAAEFLIGPVSIKGDDPVTVRTARLDDVSEYPEGLGKLWLGESKTTSQSINDAVEEYKQHGQTLLQPLLWKLATQGEAMFGPIAGVMLDVVKKGYGKEKPQFSRVALTITDFMLSWYGPMLTKKLHQASQIEWDTKVIRNVANCTRMIGGARIPCEFRELCMFGKSAASRYVMENGKSLTTWRASEGKEVAPWE